MMKQVAYLMLTALMVLRSTGADAGERLCGVQPNDNVLIDFQTKNADITSIHRSAVVAADEWQVTFPDAGSGVMICPHKEHWDWSAYVAICVDIRNMGGKPVTLLGKLNDSASITGFLHIPAGKMETMMFYLMRNEEMKNEWQRSSFNGMNGLPGGHLSHWAPIDPAKIRSIVIRDLDGISVGQSIEITAVRGIGTYGEVATKEKKDFFPFVDAFGQYKHDTWPGKLTSAQDFQDRTLAEAQDLKDNPTPSDWSKYGGWKEGPKLRATGHFRTEKHKGKWWLVDPEGYLFWSHGITGVHYKATTRLKGREHYFEAIPKSQQGARDVSFVQANLEEKYGKDWEPTVRELSHRRLGSWAMNTIANWSDDEICAMQKTPYTVAVQYGNKEQIAEWLKKPDEFRQRVRSRMKLEIGKTSEDPWCIGYFIDNEIKWKRGMDANLYYRIVSEEAKRAAPNKLYMGSRLHGHAHPHGSAKHIVAAAAKYCDVLSINRYRHSPSDLVMVPGADLPIIIGEFHFGALDRGTVHTGLRSVPNQEQRAYAYEHYLQQALKHPHIVGAHWFQLREQMITGRGDGENYQIGFLDICDTPYQETIAASRRIGRMMYPFRSDAK